MTSNAIQDAIDAAGDVYKLAADLGVSRQFLLKCRDRGWMPVRRAQEIEDKYGVPRETLIKPELRQFILGEG
jgi:hypothetical protein